MQLHQSNFTVTAFAFYILHQCTCARPLKILYMRCKIKLCKQTHMVVFGREPVSDASSPLYYHGLFWLCNASISECSGCIHRVPLVRCFIPHTMHFALIWVLSSATLFLIVYFPWATANSISLYLAYLLHVTLRATCLPMQAALHLYTSVVVACLSRLV